MDALCWMNVGFVLWLLGFHIHLGSVSACVEDERSSLLDFKRGLLDFSGRLSSWQQGYNCCQWKGISCHYHTGHVIGLDLKAASPRIKKLSGEIHQSLFNLHHLQHLDLSWNDFNGVAIPPQIAKLQKLTFLRLSNAGFGGEIPVELGNISTLRYVDLSADMQHATGLKSSRFSEWVRNLKSLQHLRMKGVNLTMASMDWGESLTSLSNIRHIYLSDCGISGTIPSFLNLTHLSHLHLSGNSFPFPIPTWFQNVSTLVSLDLSDCGLLGSIPINFLHRSQLNNLMLSSNQDLRGNLSFILGHNSSLAVFSVHHSQVGGVIPPSIANFSKLEKLDLGRSNFTGYMPPFGSTSSSLEYLDLSKNQLNGSIPPSLGQLSRLRHLHLGANQLSGTLPRTIFKLVRLETLSLCYNYLRDSFSLSLVENLTHLQVLGVSSNQFTLQIESSWVPKFHKLEYLALTSCNIEGDFPAFLSTQYSLVQLDLSDNNIVGNIPTWLWDFSSLVMLNLSHNQLEGSLPSIIPLYFDVLDMHRNRLQGSLPALDFVQFMLDLSENEFNGSIPAIIPPVKFLSFSGNNLSGEIPQSICTERNYSFDNPLQFLDLSKNRLRGIIPKSLGRCSELLVLNLAQNDLQGEIPEELGNLTFLQTLNLNRNHLQGAIPGAIANCKDLRVLDIGNNKIQGSIPLWIAQLKKLRILSMTCNKFGGSIPPQLIRLENLQILDLSNNNFSGFIPPDLRNLYAMVNQFQSDEIQFTRGGFVAVFTIQHDFTFVDQVTLWIKGRATPYQKILRAFKFMDLSHNKLSGNIPGEMGLLRGLIALNISKNNLRGSIPESFGGMTQLESLDLSANKLSGKIPLELVNLTFLSVLHLSDNLLSGTIPQGKQFSTFEASSFAGNEILHGPPLENRTLNSGGNQEDTHGDGDEIEMDRWWAVSVGLCYGVGFATVIGVLCFQINWRNRYFVLLDRFLVYLFER